MRSNNNYMRPEHKELSQMVYKDLKIACIVRGMEFQDVVESDHGILSSFFIRNYYNEKDPELLEDFDIWMDKQLERNGLAKDDPLREFKLSSTVDPETQDIRLSKKKVGRRVKLPKKEVKKRERNDTFNVIKGTKKEYTMELTKRLFDLGKNLGSKNIQDKLVNRVVEKYPDANPKSVMIWYKKALNGLSKG